MNPHLLIGICLTVVGSIFIAACRFLYDQIKEWYEERLEKELLLGVKYGKEQKALEFEHYLARILKLYADDEIRHQLNYKLRLLQTGWDVND